MARGPIMNEARFGKIKEMLQINRDKGIGWTLKKIGELNGCSGDTISRVNRAEDWPGYHELLKQEGERKKLLRQQKQQAEPEEALPKEQQPNQLETGLNRAITELQKCLENLAIELEKTSHKIYQINFLSDFPKGE